MISSTKYITFHNGAIGSKYTKYSKARTCSFWDHTDKQTSSSLQSSHHSQGRRNECWFEWLPCPAMQAYPSRKVLQCCHTIVISCATWTLDCCKRAVMLLQWPLLSLLRLKSYIVRMASLLVRLWKDFRIMQCNTKRMYYTSLQADSFINNIGKWISAQYHAKLQSTATHTHKQPFYGSVDFVRDNLDELVRKGTFCHLLDFLEQNEDTTGRRTNNLDGLPAHPD